MNTYAYIYSFFLLRNGESAKAKRSNGATRPHLSLISDLENPQRRPTPARERLPVMKGRSHSCNQTMPCDALAATIEKADQK